MVTPYLVGQHVLVDIATTVHLCEGGGCVSGEDVGGVEDAGGRRMWEVWKMWEVRRMWEVWRV